MTPWFSAEFDAAHAFVGVLLSKAEDLRDGDGRFFEILRWRGRSERGAGGDKLIDALWVWWRSCWWVRGWDQGRFIVIEGIIALAVDFALFGRAEEGYFCFWRHRGHFGW
jgi:hypothetical protein